MGFEVSISKSFARSLFIVTTIREYIGDDFWDGTKGSNWISRYCCTCTWHQGKNFNVRGLKIRLKGCRHLQDFATTNSLSIFYGGKKKHFKNWGVFSVILGGQKWELALYLALFFFYSPSEGWHFMGLPSLFLSHSHLFPSLCCSPPEPWSRLLLNWTNLSIHKVDWGVRLRICM